MFNNIIVFKLLIAMGLNIGMVILTILGEISFLNHYSVGRATVGITQSPKSVISHCVSHFGLEESYSV